MSSHHHHAHAHDHVHDHADDLPDLLDLDAQVLAESFDAVRADLARLADGPVRRILDLGAGTGTGTFGLLRRFAGAHAVAVDQSEEMLERLRRRAEHLGLANRVETLGADLDEGVPRLAPVDLVWASGSLHHLADPDHTLAQVAEAVRPGGLVAVVELAGLPRFLPDDSPAGAAEARAHAVLAGDRATDMPAMGSDWGARLTGAGLTVVLDRPIVVDLAAPDLAPEVGQYAFATLSRIRGAVADRLEAADLALLEGLLEDGADDVRRRTDLHVRSERELYVARRP